MIIKLPENLAVAIRAHAEDQGRDPVAYAIGLLWRGIVELNPPKPRSKKTKKHEVTADVADHDWSDIFRFGEPTENEPTIDDLSKPAKVSEN